MSSRKPTGYLAVAADRPGDVGVAAPQGRERVLEFGVMQECDEPPDPFGRHPLIPCCSFDLIEDILEVQVAALDVQVAVGFPSVAGHQLTGVALFGDGPSGVRGGPASGQHDADRGPRQLDIAQR